MLESIWKPLVNFFKTRKDRSGVACFRLQREQLEARFFDLACHIGKPRGLRWVDCDWFSDVTFARDRETGLLTAFVAVNIRFEAIEGGDMEDVAAVSTIRDAAAVFHYNNGRWGTGGRALFNMNPADAVERLSHQFEPVADATPPPPKHSKV
jgi:hypothetical protein